MLTYKIQSYNIINAYNLCINKLCGDNTVYAVIAQLNEFY